MTFIGTVWSGDLTNASKDQLKKVGLKLVSKSVYFTI